MIRFTILVSTLVFVILACSGDDERVELEEYAYIEQVDGVIVIHIDEMVASSLNQFSFEEGETKLDVQVSGYDANGDLGVLHVVLQPGTDHLIVDLVGSRDLWWFDLRFNGGSRHSQVSIKTNFGVSNIALYTDIHLDLFLDPGFEGSNFNIFGGFDKFKNLQEILSVATRARFLAAGYEERYDWTSAPIPTLSNLELEVDSLWFDGPFKLTNVSFAVNSFYMDYPIDLLPIPKEYLSVRDSVVLSFSEKTNIQVPDFGQEVSIVLHIWKDGLSLDDLGNISSNTPVGLLYGNFDSESLGLFQKMAPIRTPEFKTLDVLPFDVGSVRHFVIFDDSFSRKWWN